MLEPDIMKVQSLKDLAVEMRAVARGEIAAPADAAAPSVETAKAGAISV